MGLYFGTDGIRGVALKELDAHLAFKCGNALARFGKKIIIARDTRPSGNCIKFALVSGFLSGGGNVYDLGVAPTPAVAYLTKTEGADFGVVISASHNPPEFNGIKIFDSDGFKLGEDREKELENTFSEMSFCSPTECGGYFFVPEIIDKYIEFLTDGIDLKGLTVSVDCSNGASGYIAERVFEKVGAKVFLTGNSEDGKLINDGCGSTHIENLVRFVGKTKPNIGFSFDGDADRVIAVEQTGKIIDGDLILFALAEDMLKKGKLKNKLAVGTPHTNLGIIKAIEGLGIKFLTGDVGDKFVMQLMKKTGAVLGAEQSGHVILFDKHTTGDGLYAALRLSRICLEKGGLEYLTKIERYEQTNISVPAADKIRVMGNADLNEAIEYEKEKLGVFGRISVRASGTEPIIRVLVETRTDGLSKKIAERLRKKIEEVE